MTINYLSADDIARINTFQIMNYSPKEQLGIKDKNALEMACNQPRQIVFNKELYPSIEEKAAILMINLIKKHPFFNANKRTAVMAVDIFLQLNGYDITFEVNTGIDLVVFIATFEEENFETLKEYVSQKINEKLADN